jgi:long-subunit acyl-CoA synthetase (AMP-forming)
MKINDIGNTLKQSKGKLIAFRNKKRVEFHFNEIYPIVINAANFLKENGFNSFCTVGIIAANEFEWVITDLACIWCGIKLFPIEFNTDASQYYRSNLKLSAILIGNEYSYQINSIEKFGVQCIKIEELARQKTFKGLEINPHIYYDKETFSYKTTSGSTGIPKVIAQSVESTENSIIGVQQLFHHTESDRILVFLPLSLLQQRYWLYSAIAYNFTIIIIPKQYVFAAIKEEKPTIIMGVPYFYELIYKEFLKLINSDIKLQSEYKHFLTDKSIKPNLFLPFKEYLGGNIRYLWTGSSPISNNILEFYFQLGINLYQGYGMNETCIIAKNYPGNNKIGSVGKLFPNVKIRFDKENQILVKNQYPVCTSYILSSEEDKSTFREDGYINTGDIGFMDNEGYLFISGRIKEMIALSNSKKVFPSKIERKICSYDGIKNCFLYGDNQPYLSALIIASNRNITRIDIQEIIDKYNISAIIQEQIYSFFMIEQDDFDEMLTIQNKIARNKVYQKYANEFKKLYAK